MSEWKKTFCALCYHNCGLEIQTQGHRITKVRPDRDNPRTKGYACRKGMKIAHYQDHRERLTHPLKREGTEFVKISWDQAVSEISEKLKQILDSHGPRSLAYMGGGGQGCHMETGFGRTLLTALGSQYHYSALAQELTGLYWINGRAYGRQNLHLVPDLDRAKNFLVMGWNGYVSNSGVNRARKRITEFAKDPDRQLIVIDPLLSETAKQANTHVQIRIGTAALFLKALISIVVQEGWENRAYIHDHCRDFGAIAPWFKGFDVPSALGVCGVRYDTVKEVARLYATSPTAMRTDLGLLMDRQSTLNSYLEMVLMAVCGRIGTPGGNVFNGHLMPMGPHSDERDPKTWRTEETHIPAIMGYYPPNVVPEEILSQKENRLRAMIISGSNPLRSYADTSAYEQAFKELDLLVTIEIVMSETACLAHYVLPARSAFEKWDATFFSLTFPETYFQLRHPHCDIRGEPLEEGEIYTRLAESLGLLPHIPQSMLQAGLSGDRKVFTSELVGWMRQDRNRAKLLPFVLAKTLGQGLHSAHLASLWGLLALYPQHAADELAGAGYEVTPSLGDSLFQRLLEHPEGLLIGRLNPEDNLEKLRTPDKKIHLYIEEMANWVREIEPEAEKGAINREDFPLVLVAGRHFPYTANSIMRDPAWNDNKTPCTAIMHKNDVNALGLEGGTEAWVTTEASRVRIPIEISDIAAPGTVIVPHGFGLDYGGETYGVNVNRLTKNTHRDRVAATPLHRYVPCRVEACGDPDAEA
jgi:anaerobic selenocysteine-containing dehydrogenase